MNSRVKCVGINWAHDKYRCKILWKKHDSNASSTIEVDGEIICKISYLNDIVDVVFAYCVYCGSMVSTV